jgi:hypothetical protein
MVLYDSEFNCLRLFNGTKWVSITAQTDLFGAPGNFSTQAASSQFMSASKIMTDAIGNAYIMGQFSGTITFGTLPAISSVGNGLFLLKLNSNGSPGYLKKLGSTTGTYLYGTMTLDASNNIYITGTFSGTATFGTLPSITPVGSSDIFVVKFSVLGIAQWVQRAGGTGEEHSVNIALDASNNIYIGGFFDGNFLIGSLRGLTTAGGYDVYIAKFNNSGVAQWAVRGGGTGDEFGVDLAIDASDNIYIYGTFQGTATFGITPNFKTVISAGSDDIFLAKYSSAGIAQWVQRAGGTDQEQSSGIDIDLAGNIYICGSFTGTTVFPGRTSASLGFSDIFVAKYDNTGTVLWSSTFGGTNDDKAIDLVIDTKDINNFMYLTGSFQGTANFGTTYLGGDIPSITSRGQTDIFLAKYDQSSNLWVQNAGGVWGDAGSQVTVDNSGNVYVVGNFTPSAQFGRQIIAAQSLVQMSLMFVMKYAE